MKEKFLYIYNRILSAWNYCAQGVWSDPRTTFKVNIVKTLNITVKSFFNTDIQTQACAMTHRTLLAIVPALALIFAIGRGFGFQNLLQEELFKILPTQKQAISHALGFVDSYLNQASEGIFVGVGIVFLLWTLISLLSSVEDSFNLIWGVKQGRSIWRKLSDYTAMLLILPILMICGGGFSIFVNNTIMSFFDFPFLTPLMSIFFETASYVFTCLFFAAVYILIPSTKVKIYNALISGAFAGTAFIVLQWLFVSGQLYVSKYNAIYGSFSFLPLLLLWLQLVWVICLTGCLICYASQNIFQFSYSDQIADISDRYKDKVYIGIVAIVVDRFIQSKPPVTLEDIIKNYNIPSRLASMATEKLCEIEVLSKVVIDAKHELYGYQPAVSPKVLSIGYILAKIDNYGASDFIPNLDENFGDVSKELDDLIDNFITNASKITINELRIKQL